jgi:hypothetical protein
MNGIPPELARLARQHELQLIEKPNGQIMIVGGIVLVHYWPHSKRKTCYVDGAGAGRQYTTIKQAINLANRGTP